MEEIAISLRRSTEHWCEIAKIPFGEFNLNRCRSPSDQSVKILFCCFFECLPPVHPGTHFGVVLRAMAAQFTAFDAQLYTR
jgi:hypothetical protein